jgi:hypothetical protein
MSRFEDILLALVTRQVTARDGYKLNVIGYLLTYKRPQPSEQVLKIKLKVAKKLQTVRDRKYIDKDEVKRLTFFFWVPKGDAYTSMVYDATH